MRIGALALRMQDHRAAQVGVERVLVGVAHLVIPGQRLGLAMLHLGQLAEQVGAVFANLRRRLLQFPVQRGQCLVVPIMRGQPRTHRIDVGVLRAMRQQLAGARVVAGLAEHAGIGQPQLGILRLLRQRLLQQRAGAVVVAVLELHLRRPGIRLGALEVPHRGVGDLHGIGMPAELVAQLAHRQPGVGVAGQALRRGQCLQQAGRLGLVAGTHQHAAELAPRVLVAAADQEFQLALRLDGIAAIQRQLGPRLGHRGGPGAQRLPAIQRALGGGAVMHGNRQPGGTLGHLRVVAQGHRLVVMAGRGLQVGAGQRHLAGQQLRQHVVVGIRRDHRQPRQRLRRRGRLRGGTQWRAGAGGQAQRQRRYCRKMPQLLELARTAPHTTLHSHARSGRPSHHLATLRQA